MKQFLLATALIAVPVGMFSAYEHYLAPPAEAGQSTAQDQSKGLGDLTEFKTITQDVRKIAATGDFKAAEKRATDFETAWDEQAKTLRAIDPVAWGNIDAAADAVFRSLRTATPVAGTVDKALADLQQTLDNSGADGGKAGSQAFVDGIAVTDMAGHPVPCETLIGMLKDASAKPGIADDKKAKAADFLAKAMERCNSDDDQHADAFSAHGLSLLAK